jgi:beta,beta-carotene 9',10'-dioxygenase
MASAAIAPPSIEPTLGYETLEHETDLQELPLSGQLPPWLSGSLLRTGPAKFEIAEQRMRHWFDGLAMLHRFTIDNGAVSYGNRFLHSRSYLAAREQGRIAYSEFATDPCRSLFKRVHSMFAPAISDNANVNVARLGERFIAMTETPLPVQFDPHTLESAGVHPYEAPGQLSTAHPHLDRASGGMLNYAAKLGPRSSYRFFTLDPAVGASPRKIASMAVREPAYMHSFGLTERWLVLVEFPFVVNPLTLISSGRPYIENYRWKPQLGTRFTLLDRRSGDIAADFRSDACFAFHHVNAYDDGAEVVVDMCAYEDASVIEDLYLDRLRAGKPIAAAQLTRFRLRLGDRTISRQQLCQTPIELPRINYSRHNERPYRYVWGVGSGGSSGWLERIVKVDLSDGSTLAHAEADCFAGEPVFVARPGAEREDDGVLLSVVLDATAASSFLLVLDAGDLSEIARAAVPHHIPFGFHGQFAATKPIQI